MRRKLAYLILILLGHFLAIAQPDSSLVTVYIQLKDTVRNVEVVATSESKEEPFFRENASNFSILPIWITDNQPQWVTIYLRHEGKDKAGAGRFYIKPGDRLSVHFTAFFSYTLVTGGENEFIERNRFLLFMVPKYIAIHRDYSLWNRRKNYSFTPRDGTLYAMLEEYYKNTYTVIREHNDFDFTLSQLYHNRENYPLEVLDSCKKLFSARVASTGKWNMLNDYISSEMKIIKNGLPNALKVQNEKEVSYDLNELIKNKQYTFIDFWASWCGPCIAEIPELKKLYQKADQQKISFLSVSIDENLEKWVASNSSNKFPWKSFRDFTHQIEKSLNISYIPQGLIVDINGKILKRFVSIDDLRDYLSENKLLLSGKN